MQRPMADIRYIAVYFLILHALCTCAFLADGAAPNINMTLLSNDDNITINAHITDTDNDLATATLYIGDGRTNDVLWAQRKVIGGAQADLSFIWPRLMWRATNGTNFVQPVLAVNTIGMPPGEAPYRFLSAPCLLKTVPDAQEVTALVYFGQNGEFNSLTDLSDMSYYKSEELLKAVSPETSYGRYVRNNITLVVGLTSLKFFHLNLIEGLIPYPPMILSRSPIQHYTLRLEGINVSSSSQIFEVLAEDSAGNRARIFRNTTAD